VVGAVGLTRIGGQPEPELIYALYPAHWGRGLATEAAGEILRVAFAVVGPQSPGRAPTRRTVPSFRVMKRLGMTYERTITIDGQPIRYYGVRSGV
jgi:RimJ/RimL family protein N-acetyltransferase